MPVPENDMNLIPELNAAQINHTKSKNSHTHRGGDYSDDQSSSGADGHSRSSSVGSHTGSATTWSATHTRTNKLLESVTKSPQKSPSDQSPLPSSSGGYYANMTTYAQCTSFLAGAAATGVGSNYMNCSNISGKCPAPITVSCGSSHQVLPTEGFCGTPFTQNSSTHAFTQSMAHMSGLPPPQPAVGVAPSISNCQAQPQHQSVEGECGAGALSPGAFPLFRTVGLLHEAGRNEQGRVDELIAQKKQERSDLVKKLETLTPPVEMAVFPSNTSASSTISTTVNDGTEKAPATTTPPTDDRPLMERCIGRHLETEYGKTEALIARCDVVLGYWSRVAADIRMSYCSILREIYHVMGSAIKKAGVSYDEEQQRSSEKFLFGFSCRITNPDGSPAPETCPGAEHPEQRPPLSVDDFKKVLAIPGLRERLATLATNATGLHHGLMTFHQGILCPAAPFLHAVPMLNEKGEHMIIEFKNLKPASHRPNSNTGSAAASRAVSPHGSTNNLRSAAAFGTAAATTGDCQPRRSGQDSVGMSTPTTSPTTTPTNAATWGESPTSENVHGKAGCKGCHKELGYELKLSIPDHFRRFVPGIPLTAEPDCTEITTEASVQAAIDGLSETPEETIMLHALRFILEHSRTIASIVNPLFRKGTARIIHYSIADLVESLDPQKKEQPPAAPSSLSASTSPSGARSPSLGAAYMPSSSSSFRLNHCVGDDAGVPAPPSPRRAKNAEELPAWATEDLCCYIQILSLSGAEIVSKAKQSFFRSRRKMAIIRYNQRKGFTGAASSSSTSSSMPTTAPPSMHNHTRSNTGITDSTMEDCNNNSTSCGTPPFTDSPATPTNTNSTNAPVDFSSISESDLDGNDDFSETMKLVAKITSTKTPNPEFLKAFYQDITAFQGEFQRLCDVMAKYLAEKREDSANLLRKVAVSSPNGSKSNRGTNSINKCPFGHAHTVGDDDEYMDCEHRNTAVEQNSKTDQDGVPRAGGKPHPPHKKHRQRLDDIIPSDLFAPISNSYFQRIMIRTNRDKVDMLLRVMSSDLGDTVMPCPLSYVISQSLDRYTKLMCTSSDINLAASTSINASSAKSNNNNNNVTPITASTTTPSISGGSSRPHCSNDTTKSPPAASTSPTTPALNKEGATALNEEDEGKKMFNEYVGDCDNNHQQVASMSQSGGSSYGEFSETGGGPTGGFSDGESILDSEAHPSPADKCSPLSPSSTLATHFAADRVTIVSGGVAATTLEGACKQQQQGNDENGGDVCDLQFDIPHLFEIEAAANETATTKSGGTDAWESVNDPPSERSSFARPAISTTTHHHPSPFHAAMAATGLLVPPMPTYPIHPTSPTTPSGAGNASWTSSYIRGGSMNVIGSERGGYTQTTSQMGGSPATVASRADDDDDDDDECLHSQDDPVLDQIFRSLVALDDDDDPTNSIFSAQKNKSVGGKYQGALLYPSSQQMGGHPVPPPYPPITRQQLRYTLQHHQAAANGVQYTGPPPPSAMTREQFDHITAAMAATGIIMDRKQTPSYEEAIASISANNQSISSSNGKGITATSANYSPYQSMSQNGNLLGTLFKSTPPNYASTTAGAANNNTPAANSMSAIAGGSTAAVAGTSTSALAGDSTSWFNLNLGGRQQLKDDQTSQMSDSIASWAREPLTPQFGTGGGTTTSGANSVTMGSSFTDAATSHLSNSLSSLNGIVGGGASSISPPRTPNPQMNNTNIHYSDPNSISTATSRSQFLPPLSGQHQGVAPPPTAGPVYPPHTTLYGSQPSGPSSSVLASGVGGVPQIRKNSSGAIIRGPIASPSNTIKSVCTKASLAPSFGRSPMTNPNAPPTTTATTVVAAAAVSMDSVRSSSVSASATGTPLPENGVQKASITATSTTSAEQPHSEEKQSSPSPSPPSLPSDAEGSFIVTSSSVVNDATGQPTTLTTAPAITASSTAAPPTTASPLSSRPQAHHPHQHSQQGNHSTLLLNSGMPQESRPKTIRPSTVQGVPNFGARRSPPPFVEGVTQPSSAHNQQAHGGASSGSTGARHHQPHQGSRPQPHPPLYAQDPSYAVPPPPHPQQQQQQRQFSPQPTPSPGYNTAPSNNNGAAVPGYPQQQQQSMNTYGAQRSTVYPSPPTHKQQPQQVVGGVHHHHQQQYPPHQQQMQQFQYPNGGVYGGYPNNQPPMPPQGGGGMGGGVFPPPQLYNGGSVSSYRGDGGSTSGPKPW